MFRKLVANLPYSPSITGQLPSYIRQLKREKLARKLAVLFGLLAISLQALALYNPPQQATGIPSPQTTTPTPPAIIRSQVVRNLSNPTGNNPILKANTRLEYTVTTKNAGNKTTSVIAEDNIADLLEYSRLIDNGGGFYNNDKQMIEWGDVTLEPGQSHNRRFVVILFDTIPTTPQDKDNSGAYDCRMTNTYGNTIDLQIDCGPLKTAENIIRDLPKLGNAPNIIFAISLAIAVIYLYNRSRQLGKEAQLLRKEFNNTSL